MANVLQKIGSMVQSWFSQQQTQQVRVFTSSVREVYPDISETTAITQGFNSNTAVYSIVKKAAKKFGAVPRQVEPKGQEGKAASEVIDGPLMDLLLQPNELQGQDAFFAMVYAYFKVCGNAFIWLNRGDTGVVNEDGTVTEISDEEHAKKPILEMYVLPANMMIIVPDPENIFGVFGYILQSTVRMPIRKVDIIHWKDVNLEFDLMAKTHLRGFSPLQAGYKTLEANNSATDMTVRMNQNGGAKKVQPATQYNNHNLKKYLIQKLITLMSKAPLLLYKGTGQGLIWE
jgi:phage portal protein BeeE